MSDLAPYDLQVGGHHKGSRSHVLKDGKGRILKPLKLNANPTFNPDVEVTKKKTHSEDELQPVCRDELEFYERIATSTSQDDVTLQPLMPAFHGTQSVLAPDGKDVLHLLLGDLTWGLRQPCVADIKIGRTDHYPGKVEKKRAMLQELGFRLTGMRVVQIDGDSQITKLDPEDCKQWTIQQVLQGLDNFCQGTTGTATHLRHSILHELQHIQRWVESQRSYLLRGSSILVVYDADQLTAVPPDVMNGETVASRGSWPKVMVKLIDFAHVLHSYGNRDDNYLFGLENLMKHIENKEVML